MNSDTDKKGKYHRYLKESLTEFSNENKKKIIRYNHPIKISSLKRHSKATLEYEPDFSFKFKTGKKSFEYVIIEFLDKQNYEGIIADIIECACIPNCRLLLFLSNKLEKHKEAVEIREVISDFLDRINGEKVLDIINLHIPNGMNKEEIKKEIYEQINKKIKLPN